eukprot:g32962.t1
MEQICSYRRTTLLAGLLVFGVAAAAIPWLSFNDSPERWMPKSSVDDWNTFSEHFEFGDNIVIAIHFQREVTNDDATYLNKIRNELLQIPGTSQVIDPALIANNVELVSLTTLLERPEDPANDRFAMYRGVLFDDPQKWRQHAEGKGYTEGELSGRSVIMYVEFADLPQSEPNRKDRLDEIRRNAVTEMYDRLRKFERDDVTFHVNGAIVIQHELEKIARRVAFTFVPLSILLTFLALGAGFRSLKAVAIAIAGALWGGGIMLGGIAWAGWTLNVITVGGPTLMFVIVIATTVHFAHDASENPSDGTASSASDARFIRWVAFPCLGAALTTGVGFLMLTFNELQPTRELGVELFFGAVLAFFGAMLMWLVLHPFRAAHGKYLSVARFSRFDAWIGRRSRTMLAISFVVMVGLGIASLRVSIDADPFSFFHRGSKMFAAFRHVIQREYGLHRLEVLLIPKDRPDDPEALKAAKAADRKAAEAFQEKIAARPEVRNYVSSLTFADKIAALEQQRDPRYPMVNKLRIETMKSSFSSWLRDRKKSGALRMTFKVDDQGEGFQPFLNAVREHQPDDRFRVVLTGTAANVVVLSDGLLGGISRGLGTALLVMAGLCVVWFRSLRLTCIAFLPNVFPILAVFGLMGLFNIPLNCGSAMVMTISLGIALNDTVHFIVHYKQHRKDGVETEEAVSATVREIGRPIVMTSIVNCLGFAIFILSDFRPMFHFGFLTSIAMVAALLGDLVLLPSLLRVFDRTRVKSEPVAEPLEATA